MMVGNQVLKRAAERSAGDRFVQLHNSEFGCNFQFESAPEIDPPDLIYCDGTSGQKLLIEATAVYYSKEDAKFHWDLKRGIDKRVIAAGPLLTAMSKCFHDEVERLVEKKRGQLNEAKKIRPADFQDKVILLIDLENLIYEDSATVKVLSDETSPLVQIGDFHEVWLLWQEPEGRALRPGEDVLDIPLAEALAPKHFRFRLLPK